MSKSIRVTIAGDRLRERLNDLGSLYADRAPFNSSTATADSPFQTPFERGRLGVSVDELTPQLAAYFGAKDGVLIASVSDDSPASRAGLKAGDVVTRINSEQVRSREDLTRLIGDVKDGGDTTIGIVRDRK